MPRTRSSTPAKRSASASPEPAKRTADVELCKGCGERAQCQAIVEYTFSLNGWRKVQRGTVLCRLCRECGECAVTERPMVLVSSQDLEDSFVCLECSYYCAACDDCHRYDEQQEGVEFDGGWLCYAHCCVCQSPATNRCGIDERAYCDKCVLADRAYVDICDKTLDDVEGSEWKEMKRALTA